MAKLGCLYRATNLVTGGVYVGITVAGFGKRRAMHLKNARQGLPYHFYRAIRKHGEEAFVWTIVADGFAWDTLCAMERDEIARLKAEGSTLYNMTTGGDGTPGWVLTPEISRNMSDAQKRRCEDPAERERMRRQATGVIPSAETRKKLSEALKGRKLAPETREKLSKALTGRKKTPEQIEAMRARATGVQRTDAEKAKLSAALKGVPKPKGFGEKLAAWHRDNPITDGERAIRSARMKGIPRTAEENEKNAAAKRGKKASEETRAKMRLAHARRLGRAA